jgi:hypothetical protein
LGGRNFWNGNNRKSGRGCRGQIHYPKRSARNQKYLAPGKPLLTGRIMFRTFQYRWCLSLVSGFLYLFLFLCPRSQLRQYLLVFGDTNFSETDCQKRRVRPTVPSLPIPIGMIADAEQWEQPERLCSRPLDLVRRRTVVARSVERSASGTAK